MKNLLAFLTEYKTKKAMKDKLEKELDQMKAELEAYTREKVAPENGKYYFTCGQYEVTITPCRREDIDKKRLQEELPAIAEQYKKIIEYDRTVVK